MGAMETLTECINSLKFDGSPDEKNKHKKIYTYIEQHFVASAKGPPPLDVLIYASRNILFPTLNIDQMSDLLDLLSTVETHRRHIVLKADDALAFHAHWKNENVEESVLLTAEEYHFVGSIVVENSAMRDSYKSVISALCQMDIYHLWTRPEPSIAKLAVRMNEYYPPSNKNYQRQPALLFHADLSATERADIEVTCRETVEFFQQSLSWALSHADPGQQLSECFQSDKFANICRPDSVKFAVDGAAAYLTRVQEDFHKFERIFKNGSTTV
ncbi:hypothetical protein BDN71DRAFT_1438486 [Pleurotus eryngii]|uniref:Uncharacterized protein n=1 Tax=Pleurotus eryngii TaxID=5323 RepID=A0A9P6A9K7_PLEER|nr:hypothetical protein BDN71DRAFT_1438486 [Pleurotus eryngii]